MQRALKCSLSSPSSELARAFVSSRSFESSARERAAYLELVRRAVTEEMGLAGVQLYGLARAVQQPEPERLGRLEETWLQAFAAEIEAAGLPVVTNP